MQAPTVAPAELTVETARLAGAPGNLLALAETAAPRGWKTQIRHGERWELTVSGTLAHQDGAVTGELIIAWHATTGSYLPKHTRATRNGEPFEAAPSYKRVRNTVLGARLVDAAAEESGLTVHGYTVDEWGQTAGEHTDRASGAYEHVANVLADAERRREPWARKTTPLIRAHLQVINRLAIRAHTTSGDAYVERYAADEGREPDTRRAYELAGRARALADRAETFAKEVDRMLPDAEAEFAAMQAVVEAEEIIRREDAAGAHRYARMSPRQWAQSVMRTLGDADQEFASWYGARAGLREPYGTAYDRWRLEDGGPTRAETLASRILHTHTMLALFALGTAVVRERGADDDHGRSLLAACKEGTDLLDRGKWRQATRPQIRVREALTLSWPALDRDIADAWADRCPVEAAELRRCKVARHGLRVRLNRRHHQHAAASLS
ncbi:hypothetical protein ACFV3E_40855 [Streptomyces sp. NPDC059718]